jgi:hypothetical protein
VAIFFFASRSSRLNFIVHRSGAEMPFWYAVPVLRVRVLVG